MSKTILIIDDDPTLVAPLKDGLQTLGYRVEAAFDGPSGVAAARKARPDVIILDFYLPGGGGRSVYERLRKDPKTAGIPIVFSTVVSQEEVKGSVGWTADTFFLRKPVGLSQVVAVLSTVLGEPAGGSDPAVEPARRRSAARAAKVPKFHEFAVRVTYADTDKLGIIYYANYFKYFEQGRTELLRSLGVRYRDLEIQRKLFLPAVETGCRYLAPSRYDDLLVVRTWISSLGIASVRFENEIYDKDLAGEKVARGFSRHAVVNDLWRTARIPKDLRSLLEPYVGTMPGEPRRR